MMQGVRAVMSPPRNPAPRRSSTGESLATAGGGRTSPLWPNDQGRLTRGPPISPAVVEPVVPVPLSVMEAAM